MKTHLFFGFSNLNLMFAQAIAASLPAEEKCVLWLGAQDPSSKLYELYQLTVLPELWESVTYTTHHHEIKLGGMGEFVRSPSKALGKVGRGIQTQTRALEALWSAVANSGPVELWIPHQYDWSCRVAAEWCHRRGYPVHFYEEGLSVYLHDEGTALGSTLPERLRQAHHRLAPALVKHPYLGNSISSWLTDAYLMYPDVPSVLSPQVKVHDLGQYFNRPYIRKLMEGSPVLAERVGSAARDYPKQPFVLFLSSVEVEDNYVTLDAYLEAVDQGLKRVLNEGQEVVVKAHPRSRPEILAALVQRIGPRASVIKEGAPVPIELLVDSLNCEAVVGCFTSPLVYLNSLYGVCTVSIAASLLEGKAAQELPEIRNFVKKFSDVVQMV